MKPGWQTSEFWLTVLGGVWSAVAPGSSEAVQVIVPAVLGAAYAISRGLAKQSPTPPRAE